MMSKQNMLWLLSSISVAFGLCATALAADSAQTSAATTGTSAYEIKDNEELARMYEEDQSDRTPVAGKQIDWMVVGPRDDAREARVKEMCAGNLLKTGSDHLRAAMVLQHADEPEDYLLAHELCVIAIFKGVDARWLAAASEDRFLRSIGRPQRFGTQSSKIGDSPWSLGEIDPSVSDAHRAAMAVPSLEAAKVRLAKQNELIGPAKRLDGATEPTAPTGSGSR
jgi:hypothetical protein